MILIQPASLYVDRVKTLDAHISVDTGVPQLNFGVGASLPMSYLPTKSLSETPDFLETLPLSEKRRDCTIFLVPREPRFVLRGPVVV